jgi:inorganic pyrophosphatase
MDSKIKVYIEIEKNSNLKFEYNHKSKKLELDRILKFPFFYPYAYGFALDTKASDGDELDILIITDKIILNDTYYEVYIIGVLIMEDENGLDEKVLCVFEEDYEKINDLSKLDVNVKDKINKFFTNYKDNEKGKWSKVYGFEDKITAIKLYEKYSQKK